MSGLVENSRRHVLSCRGSHILTLGFLLLYLKVFPVLDENTLSLFRFLLSRDMTKPPNDCAPSEDSVQPGHPSRLLCGPQGVQKQINDSVSRDMTNPTK